VSGADRRMILLQQPVITEGSPYPGAANALITITSSLNERLSEIIPTCVDHFLKPLIQLRTLDLNPQLMVHTLQVNWLNFAEPCTGGTFVSRISWDQSIYFENLNI